MCCNNSCGGCKRQCCCVRSCCCQVHCWHPSHVGAWCGINPPPMHCCRCGVSSGYNYTISIPTVWTTDGNTWSSGGTTLTGTSGWAAYNTNGDVVAQSQQTDSCSSCKKPKK